MFYYTLNFEIIIYTELYKFIQIVIIYIYLVTYRMFCYTLNFEIIIYTELCKFIQIVIIYIYLLTEGFVELRNYYLYRVFYLQNFLLYSELRNYYIYRVFYLQNFLLYSECDDF